MSVKFSLPNPVTLNAKREKWLKKIISQEIENIDSILEGIVTSVESKVDNELQYIESLVEEITLTDVSPINRSQLSGYHWYENVENHYLNLNVPYYLDPFWPSFFGSKTELFSLNPSFDAVERLISKTISSKVESTIYEKLAYFQSTTLENEHNTFQSINQVNNLLASSNIELISCSVYQNVEEKFKERFLQNLASRINIKI